MSNSGNPSSPNFIWRIFSNFDLFISSLTLVAIAVDVVLQIASRLMPGNAISWTGEMGEILLGALIWFGISASVKPNGHIGFDLFVTRLSPRLKKVFALINVNLFIIYLAVMGYFIIELLQSYVRFKSKMTILGISMVWVRGPMLVGCVLGIVRLLIKEYNIIRGREVMYAERSMGE